LNRTAAVPATHHFGGIDVLVGRQTIKSSEAEAIGLAIFKRTAQSTRRTSISSER
jgi:hypothetical protein